MVLVYIGKDVDAKALIEIFENSKISYSLVNDTHLNKRIGSLLNEENKEIDKGMYYSFLLFDEVNEKMDTLRNQMKEQSIYIPRIAVQTEYNIHWTLKELMDEVDREVEYFKYKELVIKKLKNPNRNRMEKDMEYIRTITLSIPRVQKDDMSLDEMKALYKYLYKI